MAGSSPVIVEKLFPALLKSLFASVLALLPPLPEKRTLPAAYALLVIEASRVCALVGRTGEGLFASKSIKSAASLSAVAIRCPEGRTCPPL